MLPPVFGLLNNSTVNSIVDSRIYTGTAPQGTPEPYVTWHVITGTPANTVSDTPGADNSRVQIDCWASDKQTAINLATAVRDSMEAETHMLSNRGLTFDNDAQLHRCQLDFSFWTFR